MSLYNVFQKCLLALLLLGNFVIRVSCYCFDVELIMVPFNAKTKQTFFKKHEEEKLPL